MLRTCRWILRFPLERLAYMIADAGLKAVATTSGLAHTMRSVLANVRVGATGPA